MIENSTQVLTGYSYSRGNYSTNYFDKTKFVELMLNEVAKVIESRGGDIDMISAVKDHFLKDNNENHSQTPN